MELFLFHDIFSPEHKFSSKYDIEGFLLSWRTSIRLNFLKIAKCPFNKIMLLGVASIASKKNFQVIYNLFPLSFHPNVPLNNLGAVQSWMVGRLLKAVTLGNVRVVLFLDLFANLRRYSNFRIWSFRNVFQVLGKKDKIFFSLLQPGKFVIF